MGSLERLQEPSLQELTQLSCSLELWDGIQFLECRREGVRQTPDCSRPEFIVFRLEVQVMHRAGKMLGNFKLALDKGLVDHNLGSDIREFASLPSFYLLSHGLKVPLHSVDPDRDGINQRKRFRVFGEHWPKHARTMLPSSALPSHVTLPSRPASDVSHLSHQGFK